MAAKSTLKNMVLCLTGVCLVCSALLAGTFALTSNPIADAQKAKTNASIARVLPEFSGDAQPSTVSWNGTDYTVYTAAGAGVAVVSTTTGFGGPLSVMVGITDDGKVYNTAVLSHSETPGLGAKCQTDTRFLDQFKGLDPAQKKLAVTKDGGDLDAITASTITSRAYILAVKNAVEVFKTMKSQEENE